MSSVPFLTMWRHDSEHPKPKFFGMTAAFGGGACEAPLELLQWQAQPSARFSSLV